MTKADLRWAIGFINFGAKTFKDGSGFNLDNQVLIFKVKLPVSNDDGDDD